MTLEAWTAQIVQELTDAGYDVRVHHGFPLVQRPTDWG
jgi:hypothetical protein